MKPETIMLRMYSLVVALAVIVALLVVFRPRGPTAEEFAAACTAAGGVAMKTLDGPDCLKIETIPVIVVKP